MSATLQLNLPENLIPNAPEQATFREAVRAALRGVLKRSANFERRQSDRHPYPYPIHITPLSATGEAIIDDTFIVIGRHLSELGVDFYHNQPVPYRTVLASLQAGKNEWIGVKLDLTWCRFRYNGLYENGGRFLRLVESPINPDVLG